jgi:hypothetical protein
MSFCFSQDTLASMSNLALFLSEQKGRLGEAESLHRRVCARWAKRYRGAPSPAVKSALTVPALVSRSRGIDHPGSLAALTQLAQFLDVKRSKADPEVTSLSHVGASTPRAPPSARLTAPGTVRCPLQCAEEARRLYQRSFEGRREKLGTDHPSTQFSHYLLNRFSQKMDAENDFGLDISLPTVTLPSF